MCLFVSWIELGNSILYINDNCLGDSKGKELKEYLKGEFYYDEINGHGAIRHYYDIKYNVGKCREINKFTKKNINRLPEVVLKDILEGNFRRICTPEDISQFLNKKAIIKYNEIKYQAMDEYNKIISPAGNEYKKTLKQALGEYEKIKMLVMGEYNETRMLAMAECDKTIKQATEEYNKIKYPVWEEFNKIRINAFWRLFDDTENRLDIWKKEASK